MTSLPPAHDGAIEPPKPRDPDAIYANLDPDDAAEWRKDDAIHSFAFVEDLLAQIRDDDTLTCVRAAHLAGFLRLMIAQFRG